MLSNISSTVFLVDLQTQKHASKYIHCNNPQENIKWAYILRTSRLINYFSRYLPPLGIRPQMWGLCAVAQFCFQGFEEYNEYVKIWQYF